MLGNRIDRLVNRIIRERQHYPEDRGDLLSMLILACDDEGRPMSERQLRDEVITLLLANSNRRGAICDDKVHRQSRISQV